MEDLGPPITACSVPRQLWAGWKRYEPKEINRTILMAYGYGDGGGGPDEEMLEMGLRMQRGIPGFPKVTLGHVRPFFEKLAQRLQGTPYLPVWNGELYLELHQGAYTSCAWIKRNNRIAERELGAAEWLQTAAMLRGMAYDAQTLSRRPGRRFCSISFHDTLPGSCIGKVYEDAKEQFSSIYAATDRLIAQAGDYLWGRGTQELVYNDLRLPVRTRCSCRTEKPWPVSRGRRCRREICALFRTFPRWAGARSRRATRPTRLLRRGRTRRLRPALCESSWTARGPSRGSTISA